MQLVRVGRERRRPAALRPKLTPDWPPRRADSTCIRRPNHRTVANEGRNHFDAPWAMRTRASSQQRRLLVHSANPPPLSVPPTRRRFQPHAACPSQWWAQHASGRAGRPDAARARRVGRGRAARCAAPSCTRPAWPIARERFRYNLRAVLVTQCTVAHVRMKKCFLRRDRCIDQRLPPSLKRLHVRGDHPRSSADREIRPSLQIGE